MPATRSDTATEIKSYDPGNPDRLVGSVPALTDAAIESVVERAAIQQTAWSTATLERVSALQQWADALEREKSRLVDVVIHEVGKPLREATGEVTRTIAILRYYAQAALDPIAEVFPTADSSSRLEVERRPLGTVLALTPWNFPAAIPVWKIAPALAYGNTVLFRPSSAAVATANLLISLAPDSLTSGPLQLVTCRTDQVDRLLVDRRINGVSFTGSAEVGNTVVQKVVARGGTVQAEMGGQNASIVLADADLDEAASIIADATMAYAGQKCTATSRVIVEHSIAARFKRLLTERVEALGFGDPSLETTSVGPVISREARSNVDRAVRGALSRGARLLTGGESIDGDGWFFRPTLVSLDDPADEFAQEETFGPAASVLVAHSPEEAVQIANSTRYGLSAAVFGSDIERAVIIARRLTAGLIRVNTSTTGVEYYAPFGGEAASSFGAREQGKAARDFYTRTRTLVIRSLAG